MNRPTRILPADRACAALLRALRPIAGDHRLIAATSRSWASATFEGARHRIALALEGGDVPARAARIAATLGETELEIAGGFVADISVVVRIDGAGPVIGIEALTIDEPVDWPAAETGLVAFSRDGRRAG